MDSVSPDGFTRLMMALIYGGLPVGERANLPSILAGLNPSQGGSLQLAPKQGQGKQTPRSEYGTYLDIMKNLQGPAGGKGK